ncbi:MAG: JAB domain-containing protein [Clostridium sp.]
MSRELKQVDVRLKLTDKESMFSRETIDTPEKAVSVLAPVLAELDREEVCVVNLDGKGHPINFSVVSIGSVNSSLITGRELYKSAILSNAAAIIMIHNHPSSDLQMSRLDLDVTEKMMYAGVLLDIDFYDHVLVAGSTGEMFSMREHVPELFELSQYPSLISHGADGVKEEHSYQATSFVPVTYEILQIKEGSNGEAYRFLKMSHVQASGMQVNADDYESKYKEEWKPGETLETIYERFNIHRPEDFTGHSLSVSDVVVLESETEKKAFYVDSFGFSELKDFFVERFERTEQQKKMIAGFREKTETYFRPVEGMNATEVEDAVRDYLMDTIRRQDLLIQIGEVMVYGSRCRGTEKTTSDIDIVVEYKGDIREDDLFNLFHEDEFLLGNHKVDINPIQADKSGNIAEFLQQATIYMESEMVFSIGNRYIYIQNATEGYDYTIYGLDMKEIDGGVYDDSDISIYEALDEIVADLREYPDGNIVKGSVRKDSPLVPVNLDEFEEAVERSQYVPPKITYTVAECGEFHSMGRYRDDIENVNEAITLWNEYKKGTLNGVPSIGILVYTPGQTELEDVQVDLVSGKTMDLDMIWYYPEINTEEIAIQKICELVENLHDVEVIGKVPENVSAELILREFDPEQEIYNEEERSLIKEYALQVKDMQKTKGLARCICYQEKFGNQDVALAMITARGEIEEMKEIRHGKKI